jgi:hypothetical protein
VDGRLGRDLGVESSALGASRRGSTDLRYEVKTSGRAEGESKGTSRLDSSSDHLEHRAGEMVDLLVNQILLVNPQLEVHTCLLAGSPDLSLLTLLLHTLFFGHPHTRNFSILLVPIC